MVKTFDLNNKVILVTGGYGHLGKAIVDSLTFHNARVYVLARDKKAFDDVYWNHPSIQFQYTDVSSSVSISDSFSKIAAREGKIDVLINNAFYSRGQSPEHMSDEDFMYGLEGTLASTFKSIKAIIPYFKEQKMGKIINVSSMYGMVAPDFEIYDDSPQFLNPPHYGASKAGIIQITKYYAAYLGKLGIQVNAVTPGPFPSESVQRDEAFIQRLAQKTVLGKIGKPEDLAGTFVFLSSDAANYITGQNIIVDGGWTVR